MSGLVNKVKNFIEENFVSAFEDEDEMFEELNRAGREYPIRNNLALEPTLQAKERSSLKVVRHPSTGGYEVIVIEPRSFEESLEIVNNLRDKRSVILNLHLLDSEQSQRIVDFLSGATHAIDGNQQKIGDGVFIFTPNNVAIASEHEQANAFTDAFWNQPQ